MTRVLVIDDDEQLGRSIARIAERAGHEQRVAEDLARANAILAEFVPDLVIIEIQLEWVPGLASFRAQLDLAGDHRVPIIFTIGRRELYRIVAELALPMDDWVGEPLDPADLEPRIARALRRAEPSQSA